MATINSGDVVKHARMFTFKRALFFTCCAAGLMPNAAMAQDMTTVPAGTTQLGPVNLNGDDVLTVEAGGAISGASGGGSAVNINADTTGAGVVINNSGVIERVDNAGGARGIQTTGAQNNARNATINNNATGIIRGDNDGIRIILGGSNNDISSSTITINNAGIIESLAGTPETTRTEGQGFEVNSASNILPAIVFNNLEGGILRGNIAFDSDALNTTLTNDGEIRGGPGDFAVADGGGAAIRFDDSTNSTTTLNDGSITAAFDPEGVAISALSDGSTTIVINDGAEVIGDIVLEGAGLFDVTLGAGALFTDAINGSANTGVMDVLRLGGEGAATLGEVSGFENLVVQSGVWTLNQTFEASAGTPLTSATVEMGGTLNLADAGVLSATTTTIAQGGTVSGTGMVAGLTNADGIIAPGQGGIGTITFDGNLNLSSTSNLNFDFGAPGADSANPGESDLIIVTGDLVLDGTLNGNVVGAFGDGVYRLIEFGGSLTDNTLEFGDFPGTFDSTNSMLQITSNQVNLVVVTQEDPDAPANVLFFDGPNTVGDGVIDGGDGEWSLLGTNWTTIDGSVNVPWDSTFAVFTGAAGTVTVVDDIAFQGIQFSTDGYVIADGDGTLNITNPESVLRADIGVTAEIAETLQGVGGIVKTDLGTLILSGTNTFTGATSVAFGTLQVDGGAALADTNAVTVDEGATFDLADNETIGSINSEGSVVLSGGTLTTGGLDADSEVSGVISGTGGLTKVGTGTLTLSGENTFTGVTTIDGGTLLLTSGEAITDAGAVVLGDEGTLQLADDETIGSVAGSGTVELGAFDLIFGGDNTDTTFSGAINGTGGLTKLGSGTFTLDGAAKAFTGPTEVDAGTLVVNSQLASSLQVASGANAVVNAAIGGLTNAGTVSASDPLGTIVVNGNVSTSTGSIIQLGITPGGESGSIAASGVVTLNGGTIDVTGDADEDDFANFTTFTVITGSSVSGQLTGVTDSFDNIDTFLQFNPTSVEVIALRNDIVFSGIGRTPNQIAVASAFEGSSNTNPLTFAVITAGEDGARAAFDQLSGEMHAIILAESSRAAAAYRRPVVEQLIKPVGEGVAFWADVSVTDIDTDDSGEFAGYGAERRNYSGGAELGFGNAKIGLAFATASDNFDVLGNNGRGELDALNFFAYGAVDAGPVALRLGGGYAILETDTFRDITFGDINGPVRSEEDGEQIQVFGEIAKQFTIKGLAIEPFIGAAWSETELDGLSETGDSDLALEVSGATVNSTMGNAGIRLFGPLGSGVVLDTEVGIEHFFDNNAASRSVILGNFPTSFNIASAERGDWGARARLGLGYDFGAGYVGIAGIGASTGNETEVGGRIHIRFGF